MSEWTPAQRKAAACVIATAIAIPAEGLRQMAYDDTGGILTVCWGHTGKDVVKGKKYTLDECRKFLDADMGSAIDEVEKCQPGMPEKVLAAFGDITFNEGKTAACDQSKSHAARYLASHDYVRACKELPKWGKTKVAGILVSLPGLTSRRHVEVNICLEGIS